VSGRDAQEDAVTKSEKVQAVRLALAAQGILTRARSGESTMECDTIVVLVEPRDLDRARRAARNNCDLEQTYVSVRA
jgi:hypothetical protein